MAKVLYNKKLSEDFYLMKAAQEDTAQAGQFYMLRAWGHYPVLSRPISVFDADETGISFLYKVVGKGTEIFAKLKCGDDIALQGPYGSAFPDVRGKIAMVGGGVGIAPLYLASKRIKDNDPESCIDLFLGFSGEALLVDEYKQVADNVTVNVGGFVTDDIDPAGYGYILTCGPEAMMRVLFDKCAKSGVSDRLYVSMENRMACGVGACLVCSCKTVDGNKKACKDGPVFKGEAVFGI